MGELPTFKLERSFKASKEQVWAAWTDPALIPQWYGPGVTSIVHSLDLSPGGAWCHEMRMGDNGFFQRAQYTEVTPHDRLVWVHSNTDAEWNIIANPMMPDWPRELLTIVTFVEKDGQTDVCLTWTPHMASAAEIACFDGAIAGMAKGWNAGMDLLEQMLATQQA
ncbi:SRPBCC domain-containing protein [Aliiroseovarius subalbicans]|uniref:SRPBCC family protein n=1 Tax=Aliiroseovarius subalbicans TaxID=2925840 RepID=UPI001F5801E8|nr:SRPBCC domain-containing protein [Aliiroseovarius subalbicans]MCI2400274.1 SRPBCC domain-containing protein [Aliiroseovarius subalbicans]